MKHETVFVLSETKGYYDGGLFAGVASIGVYKTKLSAVKAADRWIDQYVREYYEGIGESQRKTRERVKEAQRSRCFYDADDVTIIQWSIQEQALID